jgi:processive 1,2-diacylglycerol beta-glucosyltransferase
MIKLRDKDKGTLIGSITEEQLQFLIDQLEEESGEDRDYFINVATLEMLEGGGADEGLLKLLRKALGSRSEMEIEWSRS